MLYIEYINVSVHNTTIYFTYIKNSILSRRHVSTFTGSSSGPQRTVEIVGYSVPL